MTLQLPRLRFPTQWQEVSRLHLRRLVCLEQSTITGDAVGDEVGADVVTVPKLECVGQPGIPVENAPPMK